MGEMSYKPTDPFYLTQKWKRKRKKILRRDEYLCQEAKRYGRTESAEMVHHIFTREEYPEIEFEDWNLISLSNRSHNSMHKRESHELTREGLRWQEKRKKEFEAFYLSPLSNVLKKGSGDTEGGDFFQ
ncbi:HNH endonuclease [Listeria ivanovii]|uniref:HNH endonuclease n=1 Tax=Listeria ivanovii TaxID=1638 RepID=UPI001F1EDA78|nr:HNH endonuclease [Listeria ivanovii]